VSDAAPTYANDLSGDPSAQIREAIRPPLRVAGGPETVQDRVSLPTRLPRMYYEAVKSLSLWTGQSMNAIVVEALGRHLREVTKID
jgi:hypothetical protein